MLVDKIALKKEIFDLEREDRQAEREDRRADSARLLEMENKKLSAQMELEGRKLDMENKKMKFQLAQTALGSGRTMEDIQTVFKFMENI